MESILERPTPSRDKAPQPLNVIDVPGALLTLSTLSALSGMSLSTLYRDEKAGRLRLVKRGQRCTRVTAEDAREYLRQIGGAA
jgi:predicted DNA-binding transcriptional regulator AlpA